MLTISYLSVGVFCGVTTIMPFLVTQRLFSRNDQKFVLDLIRVHYLPLEKLVPF